MSSFATQMCLIDYKNPKLPVIITPTMLQIVASVTGPNGRKLANCSASVLAGPVRTGDGTSTQCVSVSVPSCVRMATNSGNTTALFVIDCKKSVDSEYKRVCDKINQYTLLARLWCRLCEGIPLNDTQAYYGFVFHITVAPNSENSSDSILTITDTKNEHNKIVIPYKYHKDHVPVNSIIYNVCVFVKKLYISSCLPNELTKLVMEYLDVRPKCVW